MNNSDIRNMVRELFQDESDQQSPWELEFVESMFRWIDKDYTPKQAAVIEKIWNKVFGNK